LKLPAIVEQKIEEKLERINLSELKQISNNLSNRYMNEERKGQSLLSKDIEAISYLVIRMPATYCAVKTILDKINIQEDVKSYIDVGAGTGAASIGILEKFNIQEGICIEREKSMQDLGKEILKQVQDKEKINWVNLDIEKNDIDIKADLVITSYMINEIEEKNRLNIVRKLLNLTNKYLIIIEPGTPAGFKNIRKIHEYAIENKIKILAPCIGNFKCTLPDDDWCHSIVRVERNKVHKYLKDGDAPYEDEKFSYIVLYKENKENKEKIEIKKAVRVLRHPIIEKGKITLKICYNGIIEEKVITKKNKELFKIAKKAKCGDAILI
jgi:ribosomal protein RSM22 (predicted rRNA methylase)